jgi:hypothetical protein
MPWECRQPGSRGAWVPNTCETEGVPCSYAWYCVRWQLTRPKEPRPICRTNCRSLNGIPHIFTSTLIFAELMEESLLVVRAMELSSRGVPTPPLSVLVSLAVTEARNGSVFKMLNASSLREAICARSSRAAAHGHAEMSRVCIIYELLLHCQPFHVHPFPHLSDDATFPWDWLPGSVEAWDRGSVERSPLPLPDMASSSEGHSLSPAAT